MKVQRSEEIIFQPIHLILENQDEVNVIYAIFNF